MNTQIQEGMAETSGDRLLANAVGARLLVEVPSWKGVAWPPGGVQLARESSGRRLANLQAGRIFGRRSGRRAA